jgi:hypothetical protein
MNFIISTNDDPIYYGFTPIVSDYYRRLGNNVNVVYLSEKKYEAPINCNSLTNIKPVQGYDIGVQAKLARSYIATTFPCGVYTLLDVDQILINLQWLHNIVKKHRKYLFSYRYDIIAVGSNVYAKDKDIKQRTKWPMYFTTGTSTGFKKLFNISDISFEEFLEKFSNIPDPIDKKESTKNSFSSFSDESLFRYCSARHKVNIVYEEIPMHGNTMKRIDRVDSNVSVFKNEGYNNGFWNQKILSETQKSAINQGFFTDCFPERPYEKYKPLIDDIVKVSLEYNNEK